MARGIRCCARCGWMLAVLLSPLLAIGGERPAATKKAPPREVELFAAAQSGEIEVKFIPKNDREARVLITNRSRQPLSVRLPEAFAAVPVLAQQRNNAAAANAVNQPQALGSGFNVGNGNSPLNNNAQGFNNLPFGNNNLNGAGIFSIPAEKTRSLKLDTVCLEHGKRNPRPEIPYEMRPLEDYSDNADLANLLRLFASGQYSQRAAQAAAWHLTNNMSWEALDAKRIERANGTKERYFSKQELKQARQMVQEAAEPGAQRVAASSSGSQN